MLPSSICAGMSMPCRTCQTEPRAAGRRSSGYTSRREHTAPASGRLPARAMPVRTGSRSRGTGHPGHTGSRTAGREGEKPLSVSLRHKQLAQVILNNCNTSYGSLPAPHCGCFLLCRLRMRQVGRRPERLHCPSGGGRFWRGGGSRNRRHKLLKIRHIRRGNNFALGRLLARNK